MRTWGPLFKQAKEVDFYVCGHEHTLLQHLSRCLTGGHLVCGGGWRRERLDQAGCSRTSAWAVLKPPLMGLPASDLRLKRLSVELINSKGKAVHAFTRDKDGSIKVTLNTPSTPATTKPLNAIQGVDDK